MKGLTKAPGGSAGTPSPKSRLSLTVRGAVQGVGFRPFIYRLAAELQLTGWVNNSAQGVFIEVEGTAQQLQTFLHRLEPEKPPRSSIGSLEYSWLEPAGYTTFEIRPSAAGEKTAVVLPDISTCSDCLREILDPTNRRYRYPFTNCTNCGPRYSIIEALPYDRCNTTMKRFQMCEQCRSEYENPLDRRFHAQPNACPTCGPHLELWDSTGTVLATGNRALLSTVEAICQGKIVAVKGLGGFHLMVLASSGEAVRKLRRCKRREEKPFALMSPSVEWVRAHCEVSPAQERLLRSPEAPIVLLRRRGDCEPILSQERQENTGVAPEVAPGNPYLGVMLGYAPLHHLLLAELGVPVVCTSGNVSDEPICIDQREAIVRLAGIAELFLVHNRPIVRPVDDSVVRVVAGREMVVRRARGYAPLPVQIAPQSKIEPAPEPSLKKGRECPSKILAVGAHLKNTIAIATGSQVFVSQHIGDLETPQAFEAFERAIESFKQLYEFEPEAVACDAHPDYRSAQFAQNLGLPVVPVQHHFAHALACMAENQLLGEPVLAVAWDGTGYGLDGTIWGGEFLLVRPDSWQRIAHLSTFRLAGGDRAVKEPRRVALGLLYELFGDELFGEPPLPNSQISALLHDFFPAELKLLQTVFKRQINAPVTSSAGRLFDGVARIAGLRKICTFEGQAAMELEFALHGIKTDENYPIELVKSSRESISQSPNPPIPAPPIANPIVVNWKPMLLGVLEDVAAEVPVGKISAKFHNTLVEAIVAIAKRVGENRVALTGGCFQNQYLTERAVLRLSSEGFRPYWHQRIPPNDGGIALGQIVAARGGW
ncbi:carbamoyltransferase HypF [Kamptonema formosum]|uniref:carbamoyltransferase HypF n=1 Tax=Kamptonema formosum TaxID=331992 RepID=UPI00034B922E|nr:carbamoyltransferase HypF [Oscillatoria sp. PCC 10802]